MNEQLIKEATEELYNINASISALYCTRIRKPTLKDIDSINEGLGKIIKKLREATE
jgi:hypothetical protein